MLKDDLYLTVLKALPAPVIIKDADLRFVFVNEAAARYFCEPPEALFGKTDLDAFPPEHAELYRDVDRRVLATGETIENEELMRGPDGSMQTILTRKSLLTAGEVRYVLASFIDVTALRQSEEQLRQAQKMEAIGQLTGGIAHDFNNHLGGIICALELMQSRLSQGRSDGLERYTGHAMASAQRASSLTHRLLAFSRRQSLMPRPVDAVALVMDMEVLMQRSMGPSHRLRIEAAECVWPVFCDFHQLENAILNLAINARDAMRDGGELRVAIENCTAVPGKAVGEYVRIDLTDSGTGMSAEVIARAIEPFFTTKPAGQGTGLGLSMVYGFAKQSGGYLHILSSENCGTTVSLYLPRYRGKVRPVTPEMQAGLQKTQACETVLLVEDDTVIRQVIADALEELGYCTLVASDGPSGLHLLEGRTDIQVLVTDIGLPGMNGRELATRALRLDPQLKVLFITGYDKDMTLPDELLAHGVDLMTKPFTITDLASRMHGLSTGEAQCEASAGRWWTRMS